MIYDAIQDLVQYAIDTELIEVEDSVFVINALLPIFGLKEYIPATGTGEENLEKILKELLDFACAQEIIEDSIVYRDLLDTKIMGVLTPFPREVIATFESLREESPQRATDWYYTFSQNTDYIRRYRILKDKRWKTETPYGLLDITINLSKPEKDPKAIAAAKNAPPAGYPKCMLCRENEGYVGSLNHPARQNHRVIPMTIGGKDWFFQYSPYVYYNEHCIVFHGEHVPMKIEKNTFEKMFDFIGVFPHYFVGSNADLPIVGGSILSHDHFQGGRYVFAMETAETEETYHFQAFPGVSVGILHWPMSVLRLRGKKSDRLVALATEILESWRGYSDESVFLFAQSDGEPHNTITPIARRRNGAFELDLVLRNNITTAEHPMGVFHPHEKLHHIKKENIGLIEVMGLAVLPPRLLSEMEQLKKAILANEDLFACPATAIHAPWATDFLEKRGIPTPETMDERIQEEIGLVFSEVLEDAGVFKRDQGGQAAFRRFLDSCGGERM